MIFYSVNFNIIPCILMTPYLIDLMLMKWSRVMVLYMYVQMKIISLSQLWDDGGKQNAQRKPQ